MVSWFPSGNRGMKLTSIHILHQIPPWNQGWSGECGLWQKQGPFTQDRGCDEQKTIQSNDVNQTGEARFQPNTPNPTQKAGMIKKPQLGKKCMRNMQRKTSLDIR